VAVILAIVGTRPEAIKLAPVIHAAGLSVLVTGQHPELAEAALAAMDLAADHRLEPIRGASLEEALRRTMAGVGEALAALRPRAVVVHGDTTSAFGGALAARYAGVPLAHVEAGLRTGDERAPFPEEMHRRLIDAMSDRCWAPTPLARDHLLREGVHPSKVIVTGNPIVDAVRRIAGRRPPGPGRGVLVTAHRRENLAALGAICEAVAELAGPDTPVCWPVHPNPAVERIVRERLAGVPHVSLVAPLPYPELLQRLAGAALALTDSGGLQEEAAVLGTPTLVLRDVTERPEVLATGVVALVGTEPGAIVARARAWLRDPPRPVEGGEALGDGEAGPRIARDLAEWLG
jgi:UDP-N-acetylglucosamine 2-epimerase (non-hydrolysing)